jgi:hypothetical protein
MEVKTGENRCHALKAIQELAPSLFEYAFRAVRTGDGATIGKTPGQGRLDHGKIAISATA